MVHDEQFGPVVIVSAGGRLIETLVDRVAVLPPIDKQGAVRVLGRLRIRPLLDGARGDPPADLDSLAEVIARFSELAAEQRWVDWGYRRESRDRGPGRRGRGRRVDQAAMSGSNLLVEDKGPIRRITLNRPEKLNALDSALVEALSEALRQAADDTDVRVIVIAGAGRSFCAGYDLSEESGPGSTLDNLTHSLDRLLEVFDHPRPIIAQVHGHCLAGGCDLMMMCDLAVASDDAVFGQPEIRFGSTSSPR